MKLALRMLLLMLLTRHAAAQTALAGADPPSPPHVIRLMHAEWPRDYGYSVGDALALSFILDVPQGWALDRDGLPRSGLTLNGFELRSATLQAAPQPDCPQCQRLSLHWQLFHSVREPTVLKLPQPPVRFRKGATVETLKLPLFTLHAAPLRDWLAQRDWSSTLQDGVAPQPYALRPAVLKAAYALVAAASLLLVWAWSTGRFASAAQRPFAAACRSLRKLDAAAPPEHALRILHRAFDDSAGHAVFAGQLAHYFEQHPEFADLADQTQRLYAASQALFFDAHAQPPRRADILALLRALRDREKLA